jgi:hypothetical protein
MWALVDLQDNAPAKQQLEVDLRDQRAFRAPAKCELDQQCPKTKFRRYSGTPSGEPDPTQAFIETHQRPIDKATPPAQRMITRHTLVRVTQLNRLV